MSELTPEQVAYLEQNGNIEPQRLFTEADLRRAREEGSKRMACEHLQADLVADPKCRYCDEGYSRIQSSVTEAFVHVGTPVGRVVCTGNPTFIFKESPTDAHHKAMPASYCHICAEQQKVREEATVAAAHAQQEADAKIAKEQERPFSIETSGWNAALNRMSYIIRNAPLVTSEQSQAWLNEKLVAAAGAQRERDAAIEADLGVATEEDGCALDGVDAMRERILAAPLVTSPEGEKWLRERDAGILEQVITASRAIWTEHLQFQVWEKRIREALGGKS